MRVTVRFFARLREITSREAWPCEVPVGASIADVWQAATVEHPALEPFGTTVSCALNADFARMTTTVGDGDEVAFLPPVSGGAPLGR
jgi:molybdopterin converting factor subunit 1